MSKERELLRALVDVLDDLKLRKNLTEDDALNISDSVLVRAEKAIENYIARPEQEPVAHCRVFPLKGNESTPQVGIIWVDKPITGALYTSPPKREPLSDECLKQIREREKFDYYVSQLLFNTIAKRIEKHYGIGG
jgi:hypothetical protein